jgi:HK97 family phage prohead protease
MANETSFLDALEFKKKLENSEDVSNIALRKHFVSDDIKLEGGKESRKIRFTISTGDVDRDFDIINPKGWELKNFKKNPVVLFAHDSRQPPVAKASNLRLEEGQFLRATAEFTPPDLNPFGDMIFRMIKEGFMKATSVGFRPLEVERELDDEDRADRFGLNFIKQELMEFSVVPVPANPNALMEARSKGIDTTPLHTWMEEALDNWAEYKDYLLIPKSEAEKIFKDSEQRDKVYHISKKKQDELLQENLAKQKKQEEVKEDSTEGTVETTMPKEENWTYFSDDVPVVDVPPIKSEEEEPVEEEVEAEVIPEESEKEEENTNTSVDNTKQLIEVIDSFKNVTEIMFGSIEKLETLNSSVERLIELLEQKSITEETETDIGAAAEQDFAVLLENSDTEDEQTEELVNLEEALACIKDVLPGVVKSVVSEEIRREQGKLD